MEVTYCRILTPEGGVAMAGSIGGSFGGEPDTLPSPVCRVYRGTPPCEPKLTQVLNTSTGLILL